MKFIENIVLKKIRPNFTEGGKLENYYSAYDAIETFLFTPDHTTHKGAHIRDAIDLKRTMMIVITALVPCLLFGMWNVGHLHFVSGGDFDAGIMEKFMYGLWKVLPVVVVSYAAGLGVEFILAVKNKHAVQEGFLVSGMLIPLIMPADIPLWMVALATIFAVLIGKEIFGGTGMNILNVALTARAFVFFAYPNDIIGKVWVSQPQGIDAYSGESLLGYYAETRGLPSTDAGVQSIVSMTNEGSMFDMWSSFIGAIPGCIGETSVVAILIGAAILLFTGIGSWRIMLSMFLGGLSMGYIFNYAAGNAFMEFDPLHQLMVGGFMFGLVFMATDPVTAAQTNTGKWIYGFLCGFISILIRVLNPAYPEGVMLAILFMNVMAPTIDHYVVQANVRRREKRLKLKTA